MSGIDRIRDRILEDAQANAKKTIEEAQARADEFRDKKDIEASRIKKQGTLQNQDNAQDNKKRMIAVAQLEMKKELLSVKQSMIDKAFESVLDRFDTLSSNEYQSVIGNMLLQIVTTGDEEVIISDKDKERLDFGFFDSINKSLKEAGKKGELTISSRKGSFRGGFILKSGGVEINNTFESILRMTRDEIEPQVAKLLFQDA